MNASFAAGGLLLCALLPVTRDFTLAVEPRSVATCAAGVAEHTNPKITLRAVPSGTRGLRVVMTSTEGFSRRTGSAYLAYGGELTVLPGRLWHRNFCRAPNARSAEVVVIAVPGKRGGMLTVARAALDPVDGAAPRP